MKSKGTIEEKKERVLSCLQKHHGIVYRACNEAAVGTTQVYEWRKSDTEFDRKIRLVQFIEGEKNLDLAEDTLLNKIAAGDTASTIFFLKTRGKNRGYTSFVKKEIEPVEEDRSSN